MRLLVTLSVAVLLLTASPLCAQHLGARLQWQPEISDTDARLQQPVDIEILGRASVPALKLLSEATGVMLADEPAGQAPRRPRLQNPGLIRTSRGRGGVALVSQERTPEV